MDKKVLRDYLEQVRRLESDLYTMNQSITELKGCLKEVAKKKDIPAPYINKLDLPVRISVISELVSSISPNKVNISIAILCIIVLLAFSRGSDVYIFGLSMDGITSLLAFGVFGYFTSSLFGAIHTIIIANDNYRREYVYYQDKVRENEKRTIDYRNAIQNENARYEKEMEEIQYYNLAIEHQISTINNQKLSTENALRKLYDIGILYYKYRSFVPVSMFCEYLDSGRRSVLEGVDGMYDLYETELLGKKIVGELNTINSNLKSISYQLGTVSNQLVGIQRNQVLLYEEVARCNEIASQIRNRTDMMLEQSIATGAAVRATEQRLATIESSVELTAFNTAATARRTDAIAKIAEYEYAKRNPTFPSI